MALPLRTLKTTLIGGIVFLLPLIVVLTVVSHGVALLADVATPLAEKFPHAELGGVAVVTLVALALLLLLCYAAGLLARAALGRQLTENFENRLQLLYPRYTVIKAMTQGFGDSAGPGPLKGVLVTFDDHQLMAYEVERLADGRVVIFLPGSPDPWSGSVVLVAAERVEDANVEPLALNRSLKGFGRGTAKLLDRPPRMPA